ncbi:Uncharacterized protein FWK35_00001830 [Aphis craccivora]|uniref:Uncharacterized protein n=1 Tax=Aphis craccivora TaxID=307492 RepID=A0A6G0ZM10_APHCR|nr:Uncharacterized protein FWK35_00001830 [Aphis craccivora]
MKNFIYNKINKKFTSKQPHNKGPLYEHINHQQYYKIIFDNFTLNTNNINDCYILTHCGQIVKCVNIIHANINSDPVILGQCFLNKVSAYT